MFMSREKVEAIKKNYPEGTRVELNYTDDPYTKLKKGDQGSVMFADDAGQIHILWDNGSTLALIPDVDSFTKIQEPAQDTVDPELSMEQEENMMSEQNCESLLYLTQPMKLSIYRADLYDSLYYSGVSVTLPAASDFIQDALDRARISSEDKYIITELMWNDYCYEEDILKGATIEEINFLAWRLTQMDEHYGLMYDACLKMKGKDVALKDMINFTYALDHCLVAGHIDNDEDLGRFAAENDFIEALANIPEQAWDFIDFKKVGAHMRESEKGIFINGSYVECDIDNIDEVYDGATLPQSTIEINGIFNLLIAKAPEGNEPSEEQARWLYLPAKEEQLTMFLKELDAVSFDECVYYDFSTAIPGIKNLFHDMSQLKHLNALATCISGQELRKCKAVLEYAACDSIEQAINYCENLQCFDYYPDLVHPSDYGKYIFNLTDPVSSGISEFINFDLYGREQMFLHKTKSTPYGFVTRNEKEITFMHSSVREMAIREFEI